MCVDRGPPCWQAGLASRRVLASNSTQPARPQLLLASMSPQQQQLLLALTMRPHGLLPPVASTRLHSMRPERRLVPLAQNALMQQQLLLLAAHGLRAQQLLAPHPLMV